jgi:hypothetical protein
VSARCSSCWRARQLTPPVIATAVPARQGIVNPVDTTASLIDHRLEHEIPDRSGSQFHARGTGRSSGFYVEPPTHSRVPSADEQSLKALDRTQPGLPIKKAGAGTMTHDYIWCGTTKLFDAPEVLDRTVIGRCTARRRHQEFIRFLDRTGAAVRAGKLVHAEQLPRLQSIPRCAPGSPAIRAGHFISHPTSSSWANAVEPFLLRSPARASSAVARRAQCGDQPSEATTASQTLRLDTDPDPSIEGQLRLSNDVVNVVVEVRSLMLGEWTND